MPYSDIVFYNFAYRFTAIPGARRHLRRPRTQLFSSIFSPGVVRSRTCWLVSFRSFDQRQLVNSRSSRYLIERFHLKLIYLESAIHGILSLGYTIFPRAQT